MTPIDAAVAALLDAQNAIVRLIGAYTDRALISNNSTPDMLNWYIRSNTNEQGFLCRRDYLYLHNHSAHTKLAFQKLSDTIQPHMHTAGAALGAVHSCLHHAPIALVVPMHRDGSLTTPYWQVRDYALRGLLVPNTAPMHALLHDLAQEPAATGVFKIGNKLLHANGPKSALAMHLRFKAPKTPTHRRKAPAYVPTISQIWDHTKATQMGHDIVAEWKARHQD